MEKKIISEYSVLREEGNKVCINDLQTGQLLLNNITGELAVIRQTGIKCNLAKIVYIGRKEIATVPHDVCALLENINTGKFSIITKFSLNVIETL